MTPSVAAVIPTIGRLSLDRAVRSVLAQTYPVTEIIVVADTDTPIDLPEDSRITLLRNGFQSGAAWCRQIAIDSTQCSVVALLDDDDEWHPAKLERQLAAVQAEVPAGMPWVASSRIEVKGPGDRRRTWPRTLIGSSQYVPDYLFRFRGLHVGGAVLQTSSLCFPADLARTVRWDGHADALHDEPSWLIDVQRAVPGVRFLQVPDVLSTYNVAHPSVSRDASDRVDGYIDWGLQYLRSESPRILGDYLCTSPVSAAVSAQSLAGVGRSVRTAFRYGRPGPSAVAYALASSARIAGRWVVSAIRK